MSALQLFITPAELEQVIRDFVTAHGLRGCRFEAGQFHLMPRDAPSLYHGDGVADRLFLVPSDQRPLPGPDKPRPRDLGWIDVTPGRLIERAGRRILTMTTLQAEDRKDLPFRPAAWLRALKRNLAPAIMYGVKGANVVHGGAHEYGEIGYSPRALALYLESTLWKQYPDDNAEFAPLR